MRGTKNYYKILNLSPPIASSSSPEQSPEWNQTLRLAYRRALLQHHPDKSSDGGRKRRTTYTIDDIKKAYLVLGNTEARREFDRWLLAQRNRPSASGGSPDSGLGLDSDSEGEGGGGEDGKQDDFILGLEIVDLDEMVEGEGEWWRGCRCGLERGFVVSEGELEEVEGRGGREVLVGCLGCSLWVRVGFGVVEGEG